LSERRIGTENGLIRFLGTSVFLGGSAPKPPAFAALDQWHEERPGCAPRRERSWRIRGTRCGGGYGFGRKHAERRSNPGHRRCDRSRWHRLAHIMLLAQSEKCQGSGDSVPGLCLVSIQKVPENRMSRKKRRAHICPLDKSWHCSQIVSFRHG